ncbi:MAG: hypothetical protein EXS00_07300 [Phycisphaerales bacterium]|nr:hypothetical protein [Phycisphaerales bacterium]
MTRSHSAVAVALAVLTHTASASPDGALGSPSSSATSESSRLNPLVDAFRDMPILEAVVRNSDGSGGGLSASCPQSISAHTNSSFSGGSYVVQAGMGETEAAGVSFTLPADKFPLRLDLAEVIFATSAATVQTTTKWSIMIFEGTPANGQQTYTFSSDGKILPHVVLAPGTNGVNLNFSVDPADPDQIYIYDNGSHTFSVGVRIDDHNNQTQNPCLVAPPNASNAFLTTDVGGLATLTGNWLYAINCGALGCYPGWRTFGQLQSYCRPSGDWVMRMTWTPLECGPTTGACCMSNGQCLQVAMSECNLAGGNYQGDNSQCATAGCTAALVPCCFAATGGCVNISAADCTAVGGIAGPAGQSCTGYVCFPSGACCLPTGQCVGPVSPAACAAQGGVFQGNSTTCVTTSCPMPTGASCFPNGACLVLTQSQANSAGASWQGAGSTCADSNGNGIADACELGDPADLNGDGHVNGADIGMLLGAWGAAGGAADLDGSGTVAGGDLAVMLSHWAP